VLSFVCLFRFVLFLFVVQHACDTTAMFVVEHGEPVPIVVVIIDIVHLYFCFVV
jgi:hypothetical protein